MRTRGVSVRRNSSAMAEGRPDIRDKPLDELKKEITCAVCHGHYRHAKLLPCNHYYCGACIEKIAEQAQGKTFDCPECRKETRLPPGGVSELQGAFFVERMKDVYSKMAKAEGEVEAVCDQCVGGRRKSVAFCRQCAEFLCDQCVRSHQRLKVFVGHVVTSLQDLKKGGAKNIPLKEVPPPKCQDHDQLCKIFCFDCNSLICRDCTIIDHNGHNFNFLTKCTPERRKRLRDSLAPLQKVQADIAAAEKILDNEEAKVNSQKKEVCQSINQSFDMLKALLDRRKAELVKKASSLAEEKEDALTAQKKGLQVAQTEIQSLVEFVERNIEITSDHDLMCICTQLETKMEEEEIRHRYRQFSLEPSATADIFCIPSSLEDIPKDIGNVFNQLTPQALLRDVNATIPCELGTTMELSVSAPTAIPADISASVKCLSNPSLSLQSNIVHKGVGVYSITFTPQVRGRHDLIVKVKDKEIGGSPFRVFVKIPPTQLGEPVRKIEGLSRPWGIAINNKQQLVVVETNGKKISIMEQDGKNVQTIECTEFQDPRGVATAPDGTIYVTDRDAHCLFKFDAEGRHLKTVTELRCPHSVKIIHNRLYVVDHYESLVKIFDIDCNVVGTIQTKECPTPRDIAQGPYGLYVAGEKKICLYPCAPNGNFIHHLNIQPSSLNISFFWGVCFDSSGHIIATDCYNGVYVFKPSGEYVTSFNSGIIDCPAGVAVDEDGFVYVCGFWSNNVVVF